jgi:acylphosphatase
MSEQAALKVVLTGRVQGVMFRDFTRRAATSLSLNGYVRNLPGGRALELEAEGKPEALEKLLEIVKRGPPLAVVEKVSQQWSEYTGKYSGFKVTY